MVKRQKNHTEGEMTASENLKLAVDNREHFPLLVEVDLPDRAAQYLGGFEYSHDPSEADIPHILTSYVVGADGIFSVINPTEKYGPYVVGRGNVADARMLALLTALPDVVVIGSRTIEEEPNNRWDHNHLFNALPALREDYVFHNELTALRESLGRREGSPATYVLSRSGVVSSSTTLFVDASVDARLVTTEAGEKEARAFLRGNTAKMIVAGEKEIDLYGVLREMKKEGVNYVSYQGGNTLLSPFVKQGFLSQMVLSVMEEPAMGPSEGVTGGRRALFARGGVTPPQDATLITERHAQGISVKNYDAHRLRSL